MIKVKEDRKSRKNAMKDMMLKAGVKAAAFVIIITLALVAFTACASPQSEGGDEINVAAATTGEALTPTPVSGATDAAISPSAASPEAASPAAATPGSAAPATATAGSVTDAATESVAKAEAPSNEKNNGSDTGGNSSDSDKKKTEKKETKKDGGSDKKKETKPKVNGDGGESKGDDKPKTDDKPKPETDAKITVSISADCQTLFDSDPELAGRISESGVILATKDVSVTAGANVYDVIKASGVTFVGKTYISSIGGLSEGDVGAKSGWMYSVNGAFPAIGVTSYKVKDGDVVRFRYTLNGGSDVR
jgi:hypothetical protein